MRLIEADAVYKILESCEIRKATIGNPLTDWEYGYTCGIERAESEIECAPTVEAIPIEWIRKHMITHDEVVNGDYYADEAMELNLYVSDLIEKWYAERKEE